MEQINRVAFIFTYISLGNVSGLDERPLLHCDEDGANRIGWERKDEKKKKKKNNKIRAYKSMNGDGDLAKCGENSIFAAFDCTPNVCCVRLCIPFSHIYVLDTYHF